MNNFIKQEMDKIAETYELSYTTKQEFQDKVNWIGISYYQKLSEDFIREFQYKVNWCSISYGQKLSEDFIKEFQDKIKYNWYEICCNQNLSKEFIIEFADKINFKILIANKNISDDVKDTSLEKAIRNITNHKNFDASLN